MRVIVITVLLLASASAGAIVIGGSNLGMFGYPKADCDKPERPYDLSDSYAVDRYNQDVREFRRCLTEYVENADNDIRRIKEAVDDALSSARY